MRLKTPPWIRSSPRAAPKTRPVDQYRHPSQTLAFFRVEPGMTVAEGLPGGGWYTRILASYLGGDGTLYGVNYPDRLYPMFGFASTRVDRGTYRRHRQIS